MSKHDGGTAFPSFEHYIADREQGGERKVLTGKPHGGMSLRDWFAGQALGAFVRGYLRVDDCRGTESEVADRCYEIADALLKARETP